MTQPATITIPRQNVHVHHTHFIFKAASTHDITLTSAKRASMDDVTPTFSIKAPSTHADIEQRQSGLVDHLAACGVAEDVIEVRLTERQQRVAVVTVECSRAALGQLQTFLCAHKSMTSHRVECSRAAIGQLQTVICVHKSVTWYHVVCLHKSRAKYF